MPEPSLPLEIEKIFSDCPRFRVLVVGRSGVGKSSLISYAFGVEMKSVSHQRAGKSDINEEIISPQNHRFVLHDSQGFEPGDVSNLDVVTSFLRERNGKNVPLERRVHAVWLCVQTPYAGGRVFETGDEKFLDLATKLKIPVVVVFTQYDRLVAKAEENIDFDDDMTDEYIAKLAAVDAEKHFKTLCVAPLRKVHSKIAFARTSGLSEGQTPDRKALDELIQKTRDVLENDVEGDGWIVAAAAQRASATVKIYAGIAVGMRRYWVGLASGARFPNTVTLQACLDTVHREMSDSWNFHDPKDVRLRLVHALSVADVVQLLLGPEFMDEIRKLAQLVTVKVEDTKTWFSSENISTIQALLGIVAGASIAAIAGPIMAGLGLSAVFVKFLTDAYRSTPETLRCFMGYIVDLTLVLNELFLQLLPSKPPRTVTKDAISTALEMYENSHLGTVHREIREYVRTAEWGIIVKSDAAEKKVQEVILKYTM
ncbi:hypothetical protein C8F01DRAFT_453939 [Mycena amicta]|nr:hypothetical protein C8F01DRAFT_453939 [Mycena amicta]